MSNLQRTAMPPPPIPLPPRNDLAVASLFASFLGLVLLPFIGSLIGLGLGLLALYQRRRRSTSLRFDNVIWPSLILAVAAPAFYLLLIKAMYRVLMTLVCAAMLYSSNCPYQ
ncbi:hypothetical protein [Stenotrophomonas sp.]|uniref:hypothetical protein n=1 Tax=Stenotrophomonas sp. TaxID=69392 RepID=UPI0028A80C50|nr:hypothetical protein [Stenotrophomonas sp.]